MLQFKDKRLVKFGEHVLSLRIVRGMETSDVAKNCSLSIKDLQAIENGSKNFGFTTLLELAKGIGVSPGSLLDVDLDI